MAFHIEKIVLTPNAAFPQYVLATHYSLTSETDTVWPDAYTLILAHATGAHKESWEVTARSLMRNGHLSETRIRDIYSIECPNHGESALFNAKQLKEEGWSIKVYTQAIHRFLTAGPFEGAKVDFSKRRLVAVGHCLGAIAFSFLHNMTPRIRFESLIALEPNFSRSLDDEDYQMYFKKFTSFVWLQRNVWPSRKAALRDLSQTPSFRSWDPRVLDLFVEHAICEHPAARFSEPHKFTGVQIMIPKEQEAATYRSPEFVAEPRESLTKTASHVPVHLIWAAIEDVFPTRVKDYVTNNVPCTSVEFIQGVGHLIVQQAPELVAQKIQERLILPRLVKAAL